MTTDGQRPKISFDQQINVTIPAASEQSLIAIHKYQLKYIQHLLQSLRKKSGGLGPLIYFLTGCGVSSGLTAITLVTAEKLPVYIMPTLICATISFFVVSFSLWLFKRNKDEQNEEDHEKLDKEITNLLNQV